MAEFFDTRIAYHLDGTRVFHRLTTENAQSVYVHRDYTEFTPEQRAYLNEDMRHTVSFYSTDTTSQPYTIDLFARDVSFFFPVPMTLTGIWLAAADDDRGFTFEYQNVFAAVSPDTTGLDDGTWIDAGQIWVGSQFRINGPITTSVEHDQLRITRLNAAPENDSRAVRFQTSEWHVAWDATAEKWTRTTVDSLAEHLRHDGIGIVPVYGEMWRDVIALRLFVTGTFDSIGRYVSIHLFGRPTDPDEAGLTYERADGAPIDAADLSWGNVSPQSGPHVLGPFRIRNTTALTATAVQARIAGKLDWGLTGATNPAYADELYSPIMPFVQARIGGGAWTSSVVSGKHIALAVGDLAPGEFSDDIEVRFDYTATQYPPWSRVSLVMSSEVEAWA